MEIALTARSRARARLAVVAIERGQHRSAAHEFRIVSVEPPPSPPVLLRVQAPANAMAGQPFCTRASFEDVDGDVRRLFVRPLSGSGNFPPVELTGVQRQGQVSYQITVASPGRYRYASQFEDAKGLRSQASEIEVAVLAAPRPARRCLRRPTARPRPRHRARRPSRHRPNRGGPTCPTRPDC